MQAIEMYLTTAIGLTT